MYTRFFGLKQEPFSLAPDPRYLYMSKRHREALAHLLYGVGGGGGFVLLSGEIGAGKTTVCRCFLEQIPKRCNVAYIFNPKLTVIELLKSVCDEFHVPYRRTRAEPTVTSYVEPLNEFLLKTHAVGQNNVLIIDEAQNLSADVLEQLRLLTNLETNERKLLQIVLIGQPELRTMLERPELEQLAQRVVARFHLKALSEKETEHYIRHRLSVAGMTRQIPFDKPALERIHAIARGVPRRINLLCDRVLLGAYAHGRHVADSAMIEKAAREVFGRSESSAPDRSKIGRRTGFGLVGASSLALAALLVIAGYGGWRYLQRPTDSAAALAPAGSARAAAAASTATANAAVAAASTGAAALPGPLASRPAASAVRASPGAAPAAGSAVPPAATASAAAALAAASGGGGAATAPIRSAEELSARLAALGGDEKAAWRELASFWGVAAIDGTDPCAAAARAQVRCWKYPASLATIRRLGRPGFVGLRDANGRTVEVLLVGLGNETALLRAGGEPMSVPVAALGRLWQGEFGTLWRMPPGYVAPIGDGASGPLVDRLAAQLAGLAGEAPPVGAQTMDAELRAKVARFQSAQGLGAIGRAGPTTFMQLNRATGVDEPRLAVDAAAS